MRLPLPLLWLVLLLEVVLAESVRACRGCGLMSFGVVKVLSIFFNARMTASTS